jgi:phospholipase C
LSRRFEPYRCRARFLSGDMTKPPMPKIEHVIVLMLENRSFDNLLGCLYPKSDAFDGLDGNESNPWHRPDGTVEEIPVWSAGETTGRLTSMPDPDPGELFGDIQMQLFGVGGLPIEPAPMNGFIDNYMRQPPADRPYDPRGIMHCFRPAEVPILSALARSFGVSDRWHASAPCETWPNRYFAHCGTGGGWVNNERSFPPYRLPRLLPTVFRRLEAHGYSWRVYFHDLPQVATLVDLWPRLLTHFSLFEGEFERDAWDGRLPNYSFIEPRYFPSRLLQAVPNDEHPPHDLVYGEQLIAAVYNAVRAAPTWPRTLLLVLFDEHGGCFDHVPPPPAVPPGGPYPDGFCFDRYGVRVPAVIVSPYATPGSIIRPPMAEGAPAYPFDHCSILSTLHALFEIGPPPTPRVAAAPDLLSALTLAGPDNNGPARLEQRSRRPAKGEVRAHRYRRRNRHQRNLRSPLLGAPGLAAGLAARLRNRANRKRRELLRHGTVPPARTPDY